MASPGTVKAVNAGTEAGTKAGENTVPEKVEANADRGKAARDTKSGFLMISLSHTDFCLEAGGKASGVIIKGEVAGVIKPGCE